MTVIHYVVVLAVLKHTVVAGAVYRAVGVCFKYASLICVGAKRLVACGILHTICVVMAGAGRIHKIICAILFQHIRSLKEICSLRVRNQPGFRKPFHVGVKFPGAASEAVIYSPCAPVHIYGSVVVNKRLPVEGYGVGHKPVRHKHRLAFAKNVFPRAAGSLSRAHMNLARLAVHIIILAVVGIVKHVGRPYPVAVRPVHGHESPVHKVFALPELCRAEPRAAAVGSGIHVVCVAEFFERRVSEISRNHRVERPGVVMRLVAFGESRQRAEQERSRYYLIHISKLFIQ